MQPERLDDLISNLIAEGEKAQTRMVMNSPDVVSHLTEKKRMAWAQLLSSAASAEESEETVISPILEAFQFSPKLSKYLSLHAADENRHQILLKQYVLSTFSYVKKEKSLTDRLIYDGVFRSIRGLTKKRPLPIVVATLFYEWFAEEFYADLVHAAERDQLIHLRDLFIEIERDELRHRSGLKTVLMLWKESGKKIDFVDICLTQLLLQIVRLDVNTAHWAKYNHRLRSNLLTVGLDPDRIHLQAKTYAQRALNELKVLKKD